MARKKSAPPPRRLMDRLLPRPQLEGALTGLLATTYEFDAGFFELDFLPTVLGLGAWDDASWASRISRERALASLDSATVLCDARTYRSRPSPLRVEVIPAEGIGRQLLHAKVLLLVYERAVRLFVGSANLTTSGYRENREIVLPLCASESDAVAASLVLDALDGFSSAVEPWWTASAESLVAKARKMLSKWREGLRYEPTDAFVWSGSGEPLWSRFVERWPKSEPVQRIDIVSPFWAGEGKVQPVRRLCEELRERGVLADGAEVHLHAEVGIGDASNAKPLVGPFIAAQDFASLGVQVFAHAVDPKVLPEEVGGKKDFVLQRKLHAKVCAFSGERSLLAYAGSANFTRNGWGFGARQNIEAGVFLSRQGDPAQWLEVLVPRGLRQFPITELRDAPIAIEQDEDPAAPWPSFLRDVRLVPEVSSADRLCLRATVYPDRLHGDFSLWAGEFALTMERVGQGSFGASLTTPILNKLLQDKVVHVRWWDSEEPVEFPVNLSPEARERLPLAEEAKSPNEAMLLAYYQGRVSFEELYPAPPGWEEEEGGANSSPVDEPHVDTTRIQSYQMRSFVEALTGVEQDLAAAAFGTPAAVRLALLGAVSPVSLGQSIVAAVDAGTRSPTAGAFQLVELQAALKRAATTISDEARQSAFAEVQKEAESKLDACLDQLRKGHPAEIGPRSAFDRYVRSVARSSR